MSIPAELTRLAGRWQGTKQLWLTPQEPVRTSESTATIKTMSQAQFMEIHYSWADGNNPQEGRLIVGLVPNRSGVKVVWFDTWHLKDDFMICEGTVEENGMVNVTGSYSAPPGPDWGWQISIVQAGMDEFHLLMHNILPDGEKYLAVEIDYSRQS